ncbi:MAG: hypothetical protein [Inoviridae sp.]|nr:MAG: hypothetical protein [Inoviridae sp.]
MPDNSLPTSNPQAYVSSEHIGSSKNERSSILRKLTEKIKTQINRHRQRANVYRMRSRTNSRAKIYGLSSGKIIIISHYRA